MRKVVLSINVSLIFLVLVFIWCDSIARADNIYVGCPANNNIIKYDSSGNGSNFALCYASRGLAFGPNGNLYAASYLEDNIMQYDSSGNSTVFAHCPSPFGFPNNITFDRSGNLYLAAHDGIYKYDSSGNQFLVALNKSLGGSNPLDLAFDNSGNIFIAFGSTNLIKKIDLSGQVSLFANTLPGPDGLAFDRNGNLYVSVLNGSDGKIMKYDSAGNGTVVVSGLSNPQALRFDSNGNLYVTTYYSTTNTGAIQKLDLNGNMSVFATYSYPLQHLAINVPEPATLILLGFGAVMLRSKR